MKPNLAVQAFLTLLVGVIVGTVGVSSAYGVQPTIPAQIAALQDDVQALQQQVKRLIDQAKTQSTTTGQLTAIVNSQSQLISLLQQQNQELQAKLGCMSKTGDDVYFTGCNVHVRNGSGATDRAVNGLGNLIVGYNEDAASLGFPSSLRGGSHNLIVGIAHSYTSYGGLVVGFMNSIIGPSATVSGGTQNTASGIFSSISGGGTNRAIGPASSISGGSGNTASNNYTTVSGGERNTASGFLSSISGGGVNVASGYLSASAVVNRTLPATVATASAAGC